MVLDNLNSFTISDHWEEFYNRLEALESFDQERWATVAAIHNDYKVVTKELQNLQEQNKLLVEINKNLLKIIVKNSVITAEVSAKVGETIENLIVKLDNLTI